MHFSHRSKHITEEVLKQTQRAGPYKLELWLSAVWMACADGWEFLPGSVVGQVARGGPKKEQVGAGLTRKVNPGSIGVPLCGSWVSDTWDVSSSVNATGRERFF